MDFKELQQAVGQWAHVNFGDDYPRHPLLGMIEELGELAHAVLKDAQGIRGTSEEHRAKMQDAVGDITIYLIDFRRRCGLPIYHHLPIIGELSSIAMEKEAHVGALSAAIGKLSDMFSGYFSCTHMPELTASMNVLLCEAAFEIFDGLAWFCVAAELDFSACVEDTWQKVVSKRDWRANPLTGEVASL